MAAARHEACDLLVIGSGAGGLATAVTAAILGLDVLVIEKDTTFGGTTAWSGGWMWIPRNPLAIEAGIVEDVSVPQTYLRHELGNGYDDAMVTTFLEQAPRMVEFFRRETSVAFVDGNTIPDFHDGVPGAARGGRSICAAPIDGRALGSRIRDLKPPLAEMAPFGMAIGSRRDLDHFFDATRSLASLRHVARRLLRHFADRAFHRRGLHLVNGNALVARLLKSADDSGVRLLSETTALELIVADGRVTGACARSRDGGSLAIAARRGIVLAAGGFPHDLGRKAALFAHAPSGREHHSAAPLSNVGDGIRLGESAGGTMRTDLLHPGAWAPVSLVPKAGGEVGRFPHLVERAKPGNLMVRQDGRRFCNEADSYHDVMAALFAATQSGESAGAWLVCDHAFVRRWGLGRVRPRPFPVRPWLRNGYLLRGSTPAELARNAGIDSAGLEAAIARYNAHAADGQDPDFGRGASVYNRFQGDPGWRPNPCLRPLGPGPYYAVRIVPGSLGTFAGLRTDTSARVLRGDGTPVEGLYAVGNDAASVMAGRYPAGGITLAPAMTFGFVAAHHASRTALPAVEVPASPDHPDDTRLAHAL